MWDLQDPRPVKLFIGILAANKDALATALEAIDKHIGQIDLASDVWPFTQTDYYRAETGPNILRQFVSLENLIDPGSLAEVKHTTNSLEQQQARRLSGGLADSQKLPLPRPVNLDPGYIELSKLILATTKNYSHRIYIGNKMFAEVTLIYEKGVWRHFEYTYPDYRQSCYHEFFAKVRNRLLEQLKSCH